MSEPVWELVLQEDGRYAVIRDGVFKGYTLDSYLIDFSEFMSADEPKEDN
jgi:hypothetical protein